MHIQQGPDIITGVVIRINEKGTLIKNAAIIELKSFRSNNTFHYKDFETINIKGKLPKVGSKIRCEVFYRDVYGILKCNYKTIK